jgi:predicted dehydrogenase
VTIRILQIGAGIRGRHWAQLIKDYPDATCVALVEPDRGNLDQAKAIIGGGCAYPGDLGEALGKVQADAALIVSPDRLHASQAIACLDAGLTVMIEKPFTPSVGEAAEVLARAQAVGKQVIVAEQYRFFRAERTLKKLLEDGALGRIDHAHLVDRRNMPAKTEGPWLASVDHPQLQAIAVHHFDSLRMLFGKPLAITARGWNAPWSEYKGAANTEAFIDFGDVQVQYMGTMRSHRFGFSLYIEGEKGALWTDRKRVFLRKGASRIYWPVKPVAVPKGDEAAYPKGGTVALLDALRDAVTGGKPAETRGEDNIWSIAMVEAGCRSDRERREVAIAEHWTGAIPGTAQG